jgi:hypothetical protein
MKSPSQYLPPVAARRAKNWIGLLILLAIVAPIPGRTAHAQTADVPKVQVLLWFDTEDYLLPADDDADKRIAGMLTERHIRGTFKVVGEKARVLEKRGRQDVIDALKLHDIGYHSNFHSVHPAPTEYLNEFGFTDGMNEFLRRETRGAADVRRILNVPSLVCYGQPGSSWASQAVAALPKIGIPCYVDSGSHVGLGGRPFWYCGVLNVFDMRGHETRMNLWDAAEPQDANHKFDAMVSRLRGEGGGIISMCYHPCEFVQVEFWDKVNFSRGANPPAEQWKPEAQRPAEETEQAFARYGKYLDHMKATPGVEFISASQLPTLYPDRLRADGATPEDLLELARRITSAESKGIGYQLIGKKAFSPADQFFLLCESVGAMMKKDTEVDPLHVPDQLLGPGDEPPAEGKITAPLEWPAFRDATRDACDFLEVNHRIPAAVWVGPDPVPPVDFLVALAAVYLHHYESQKFPQMVTIPADVKLLTADNVARDTPELYGGWIIHRKDFQAPRVLAIARLQAWTLKPAVARADKLRSD